MNTKEVIALNDKYLMNTFGQRGISLARGKGTIVWDLEGREYLDFLTGISVNNLGHCYPKIVEAIRRQAGELIHCTNLYYKEPTMRLARELVEHSFADRVFFCNSGAEANEAAMKLARKYSKENVAPEKTDFITFRNSFHGRTFATLTATGQDKVQHGFEPLFPGVSYAQFNDLASVQALVNDSTAAILVEPVQGESGCFPATKEFLQGLRDLCDAKKIVLIFDEIQCGLGRVGRNFAYEHYGVTPDIMTLAKSLGGGLPMGAVLARQQIADAFTPGSHGGTMGGNPVAAAAALVVCEELFSKDLAGLASKRGQYLWSRLEEMKSRVPVIEGIRGLGIMIAVQLNQSSAPIVKALETAGLLCGSVAGDSIRFLPPLNVSESEIDRACAILEKVLAETAVAAVAN